MKARVVIGTDGAINVFITEGTFAEGKVKLEGLLADLKVNGVKFEEEGKVEQHRHDHEHVHSHAHTHV